MKPFDLTRCQVMKRQRLRMCGEQCILQLVGIEMPSVKSREVRDGDSVGEGRAAVRHVAPHAATERLGQGFVHEDLAAAAQHPLQGCSAENLPSSSTKATCLAITAAFDAQDLCSLGAPLSQRCLNVGYHSIVVTPQEDNPVCALFPGIGQRGKILASTTRM
eukprot:Skav212767  [mRNA]  locus=scaffold2512:31859:35654:+ [translate_table: standard]